VLAGYDFQVGLRSYRDLAYMDDSLGRWSDSMEAFQSMIDTREQAYRETLPKADKLLASDALDQLRQRRQSLQERVDHVVESKDVSALGSTAEQAQWQRVLRDEAVLGSQPESAETAESAAKLRLIKGVMFYRLNESFSARLWQQQRTLKDLDLTLHDAQSRFIRVERARKSAPDNTGDFATRVAALQARISSVRVRLAAVQQRQKAYLAQVAEGELEHQKDRLGTYGVQARFALANMYDRAAAEEPAAMITEKPDEEAGAQPAATPVPATPTQATEPKR
jgi:hypothetical protein